MIGNHGIELMCVYPDGVMGRKLLPGNVCFEFINIYIFFL